MTRHSAQSFASVCTALEYRERAICLSARAELAERYGYRETAAGLRRHARDRYHRSLRAHLSQAVSS